MQLVTAVDDLRPADFSAGSVVAVGKFDGVHLGHRAIIASLLRKAESDGLRSVVFTFANNPLSLLQPEACPQPLASRSQRLELIAAAGVDTCVMVEFNAEFAAIPAREFVERVLVGQLGVRHVLLGEDFHFGHRGLGDAALLRELGPVHGFTVEVVEAVGDDEVGALSSTLIRNAVLGGDMVTAREMLGRCHAVRGEVVHGDARGRELGFPTANLGGDIEGLVPAHGVYAGTVLIDGAEHDAAISVGVNLTFEPEGEPRVEAYVLDFSGDLYGKQVEVRFAQRIREMLPFDSVDALIARMHEDVAETRQILAAVREG
ncbi:MAG: bifunctional riboflavin kinase/FAD synthetase [Leucobacter sp.]|nr:bifunctional riboflavin kinase/FAD synthetase [Leucobacter sp.]